MPGRRHKLLLSNERKLYKMFRTTQNPPRLKSAMNWKMLVMDWEDPDQERSPRSKIHTFHMYWNLQLPTWIGKMPSGEEFYGQMRQRLSYLVTMGRIKVRLSNLRTLQQHCQAWCWEHHGLELFSCLWYWYVPQSEWNNKEGELLQSPAQWTQFLSSAVIYWNNFKTCFK